MVAAGAAHGTGRRWQPCLGCSGTAWWKVQGP